MSSLGGYARWSRRRTKQELTTTTCEHTSNQHPIQHRFATIRVPPPTIRSAECIWINGVSSQATLPPGANLLRAARAGFPVLLPARRDGGQDRFSAVAPRVETSYSLTPPSRQATGKHEGDQGPAHGCAPPHDSLTVTRPHGPTQTCMHVACT